MRRLSGKCPQQFRCSAATGPLADGRPAGAAGGRRTAAAAVQLLGGRGAEASYRPAAVPPAALVSGLGLTRARWDGESNANGRRGQAQAGGGGAAERRRSIYFQQAAEAAEQTGGGGAFRANECGLGRIGLEARWALLVI
jgi:hypothetical protein